MLVWFGFFLYIFKKEKYPFRVKMFARLAIPIIYHALRGAYKYPASEIYEVLRFCHKNDFKRIVNTIYFSIMTTNLWDKMCKMLFCHKMESIGRNWSFSHQPTIICSQEITNERFFFFLFSSFPYRNGVCL